VLDALDILDGGMSNEFTTMELFAGAGGLTVPLRTGKVAV